MHLFAVAVLAAWSAAAAQAGVDAPALFAPDGKGADVRSALQAAREAAGATEGAEESCPVPDVDGGGGFFRRSLPATDPACVAILSYIPPLNGLKQAAGIPAGSWRIGLQRFSQYENMYLSAPQADLVIVTVPFLTRFPSPSPAVLFSMAHELGHAVQARRTSDWDASAPEEEQNRLSRHFEAHADAVAVDLLSRAGYAPSLALTGLEELLSCDAIRGDGAAPASSPHPSARTRWLNVRRLLSGRGPAGPAEKTPYKPALQPSDFDDSGRLVLPGETQDANAEAVAVQACGGAAPKAEARADGWSAFGAVELRSYSESDLLGDSSPGPGLEVTAVLLKGSGWTADAALRKLREAARVLAQCGIRTRSVELAAVRAPGGRTRWLRYDKDGPDSFVGLRRMVPSECKLVVLLTGAFPDDADGAGFSRAEWTNGKDLAPALYDTVFLSDYADSEAYRKENAASPYSVMAHEMLHVLTREGRHFNDPEPNLLNNTWSVRSDRILPRHCEAARASRLVR